MPYKKVLLFPMVNTGNYLNTQVSTKRNEGQMSLKSYLIYIMYWNGKTLYFNFNLGPCLGKIILPKKLLLIMRVFRLNGEFN